MCNLLSSYSEKTLPVFSTMKRNSHEEVNVLETKLFLLRKSVAGRFRDCCIIGFINRIYCSRLFWKMSNYLFVLPEQIRNYKCGLQLHPEMKLILIEYSSIEFVTTH